MNKTMMWW